MEPELPVLKSEESVVTPLAPTGNQEKKDEEALKKVREELSVNQSEKSESQEDETQEKIRREFNKELGKSVARLSGEIQEFEESLRINKFNPISFHVEEFRSAMTDEGVDLQKLTQTLDDFQTSLKKDFMPKDERDRMSIQPHNFARVIDTLDSVKGSLIGTRSRVERALPSDGELDGKKLSENLTRVINMARRRMDQMQEAQTALRRYTDRR